MKYKGVIFDLDGTLLDSIDDLANSINYALKKLNYPTRNLDEVKSFVGDGIEMLAIRALPPDVTPYEISECIGIQKGYYNLHKRDKTKPYDGIMDMLYMLNTKGIKVAIVSNKYHLAVNELSKVIFGDLVKFAIGISDTIPKKPSPDGLLHAIDLLKLEPSDIVYVGDSEVDVRTAKNANVDFIGVSWGYRDINVFHLEGVTNIATNVDELITKLL